MINGRSTGFSEKFLPKKVVQFFYRLDSHAGKFVIAGHKIIEPEVLQLISVRIFRGFSTQPEFTGSLYRANIKYLPDR